MQGVLLHKKMRSLVRPQCSHGVTAGAKALEIVATTEQDPLLLDDEDFKHDHNNNSWLLQDDSEKVQLVS